MKLLALASALALALGCTPKGGNNTAQNSTGESNAKVEVKSKDDLAAAEKRANEIRTESAAIMQELAELKKQQEAGKGTMSMVDPAELEKKIADLQAQLMDLAADAADLAADLQAAAMDAADDLVKLIMDLAAMAQDLAADIAAAAAAGDADAIKKAADDFVKGLPVPAAPAVDPGKIGDSIKDKLPKP